MIQTSDPSIGDVKQAPWWPIDCEPSGVRLELGHSGTMVTADRSTIHFHRKHYDAMVSGAKVTTVRWNESVPVGAAVFVFDEHPTAAPIAGTVTAVQRHRLNTLTAEQAQQPPGTDMQFFGRQLRENYYPDMPDDAVVEVAELTVEFPRPSCQ
uniref:ASCH domain-containing protein n=1 Tax=Neobacillus citreus TaxID=2833578 RepID=A0A942SY87_9BACI